MIAAQASNRIVAIDTLRGFDMLMIAGADSVFRSLEGKTEWGWLDVLARQFEHPAWIGFNFYDFIFPLFLFIVGISLPFSIQKGLGKGLTHRQLYRKALIRMLILIGLGILYKNAPIPFYDWSLIRFVSVLGRIGFAGFIATILYVNFSERKRLLWVLGILLFYYGALFLIPVPGYGAGDLSFEGNLSGWIDRHFLPGRLLQGTYDELGLFTQLPALCLTVLGTSAGDLLRKSGLTEYQKLGRLVSYGIVCVVIAFVWSLHFPISKHLWSSSFILLTAGLAFLTLGLFYWVIDIIHFRRWTFFFVVIGMNSLTIYLTYRLIDFRYTSRLLFEGLYFKSPEAWHPFFESVGALGLVWVFLYILYRMKIFVKV